jgi:thermopsin
MGHSVSRRPITSSSRNAVGAALAVLVGAFLLAGIFPVATGTESSASAPQGSSPPLSLAMLPGPSGGRSVSPSVGSTHAVTVNPLARRTSEPSPMGIADYGVTPEGTPYSYSTPILRGTANVSSLLTDSGGSVPGAGYMSFQLNCELVIVTPRGNWSYWVQNVVQIETQAHYILFLNNIWNFSTGTGGGTGPLLASELTGNGSVNSARGIGDWYAYSPSGGPGNDITWYSGSVSVEVVSSVVAGLPHVAFEYNDGFGWVAYDNVTFLHGAGEQDLGFFVSGYQYTPICFGGTPDVCEVYDAEFDFTGVSQAVGPDVDKASNLTLGLEYWNGHNLAAVPSAWNFGYNTGEQIQNVVSSLAPTDSGGALLAHEANGSSGTFGPLYGPSDTSSLLVQVPGASLGTVRVGSTTTAYAGGEANLTLAPGVYAVSAFAANSTELGSANVTLAAGGFVALTLPLPTESFPLLVSGLPTGTIVTVSFHESASSILPIPPVGIFSQPYTPGSLVTLSLPLGSYTFVVLPIPGFWLPTYTGTLILPGAESNISLSWEPFTYPVTVTASGLPSTLTWGVLVGNSSANSTGDTVTVASPNGTFRYWVWVEGPYTANPLEGNLSVAGGAYPLAVSFVVQASSLVGTLSPAGSVLTLDGAPVQWTGAGYHLLVPAGTHILVASASGYVTQKETLSVLAGNASYWNFSLERVASSPSHPTGSSPLLSPLGLTLLVAAAVAAASVAALLVRRRRP